MKWLATVKIELEAASFIEKRGIMPFMNSNVKRRKHSKAWPAMLDEDRISSLPSCLIVKIISLLPTEDAVATSALSRKWKKMWTSITSLDFADKLKAPTPSAKGFERFVNRVLLLRDKSSCLQSFRMKCERRYDGSLVNTWIASILPCNVQELDLSVPINNPVLFPSDLFLCKTLLALKLAARGNAYIPNSFCLPVLKTLHLDEIELSDDESITRLLSGCPVLKELRLSRFVGKNVGVINITAPALTSLTLEILPYDDDDDDDDGDDDDDALMVDNRYQVLIDTPVLEYLYLSDLSPQGYEIKNLNHLIKTEIDTRNPDDDKFIENRRCVLHAISQVQSLVLSRDFMETICYSSESVLLLPTFINLTHLEIHKLDYSWKFILKLLEKSPHLETLHIKDHEYDSEAAHLPINSVVLPSCFLAHLKIINIDVARDYENYDMQLIKYFLKNAKVLRKLTIDYQPMGLDKERDFFYFTPSSEVPQELKYL